MNLEQEIKTLAAAAGFDLCGIASLSAPPAHLDHLNSWLDKGFQAEMTWLERQKDKRLDPTLVLPGVQGIICLGLVYNTDHPYSIESKDAEHAWISRYAWGDDYHEVFGRKLEALEGQLQRKAPEAQFRRYVDTGPISEKVWATQAGLGWQGKNTNVINQQQGSWFFLGEILTTLDLLPDAPAPDLCGTCTRCLDACPTGAFPRAYELDASRCISYLTIEHKGDLPAQFQSGIGSNIYGCDICQDVCPWNHGRVLGTEPAFEPRPGLLAPRLDDFRELTDEEFRTRFKGSAIKRTKQPDCGAILPR